MIDYSAQFHIKYHIIPCGGKLVFYKHQGKKTLFRCLKCGDIVNRIEYPDYNTLKRKGKL